MRCGDRYGSRHSRRGGDVPHRNRHPTERVRGRGECSHVAAPKGHCSMTMDPTFDEIFAVMSAASLGDPTARVRLPNDPQIDHLPTRFALALNVLLDDLAFRINETKAQSEVIATAEDRQKGE